MARVSTLVECCLSLSSAHSPSPPVLNLNTSPPSPFHATTFIPEAYSWLLENIANPYPSSEFKASLAQRYNSPVSAVSSWFANARRRMGWTALCRDFFCNCRADTVDAAYRVLVKGHSNHRLGPEVTHAFVTMKVTAEELYATSKKSALAGDLDAVVKDMPAEDGILAGDDGRGETIGHSKELEEYRRKQPAHMRNTWQKDSMTRICYPSSEPSHSSSPAPSPDDSLTDESEEDTLPPSLAGRKRCLLPSEPAQVAGSRATTRPAKRPRYVVTLVVFAFADPAPAFLLRHPTLVCHPCRRARRNHFLMIPPIRRRVCQGTGIVQISIPTDDAYPMQTQIGPQNIRKIPSTPFRTPFHFPHWKVSVPSTNGSKPILMIYSPSHRRLMSPYPTIRRCGKLSYSTTALYLSIYRSLFPLVSLCLSSRML